MCVHNITSLGEARVTRADAGRVTRVRIVLKRDEENRRGRGDRQMKEKHDAKAAATNHAKLLCQCRGKTAARRENLPIARRGCFRHMAAVATATAAGRSVGGWGHESISQQGGKKSALQRARSYRRPDAPPPRQQCARPTSGCIEKRAAAFSHAPTRTHARTHLLPPHRLPLLPTSVRFASARRNF